MTYVDTRANLNECRLSRHPATPPSGESKAFVKHYAWYADHEADIAESKRINRGEDVVLWPPFTSREVA